MHDMVIREVTLYEGRGAPPVTADVAIEDDRIRLSAEGARGVVMPVTTEEGERVEVDVWGRRIGTVAHAEASAWSIAFLGRPVCVVHLPDSLPSPSASSGAGIREFTSPGFASVDDGLVAALAGCPTFSETFGRRFAKRLACGSDSTGAVAPAASDALSNELGAGCNPRLGGATLGIA